MKKVIIIASLAAFATTACKKDEKLMERMEGNWTIVSSVKTIRYADGSESVFEDLSNTGQLVISKGSLDLEKNYDFFYIDRFLDTMQAKDILVTDEYRNRMVMVNGYADSTGLKNIVWTIEKQKRNKQVWSTYGVDSTLFYPTNNMNPGGAGNWVYWEIELKRDD